MLGLSFVVLSNKPANAQAPADSSSLWFVETLDGNEFFGLLIEQSDALVKIRTEKLGVIEFPREEIKKFQQIAKDRIKAGEYWSDNPQATRYFWAPNGYSLNEGEAYYQNVWVFFNHYAVGVSDQFSVGLGMMPTFLFDGAPTPVWVAPKFSPLANDPDSKVRFGFGALIGTVIGEGSGAWGITYGVLTMGSRDANVNIGVGMGFAEGGWANAPTFTLSAMVRTGRRSYFITENYLIDGGYSKLGIFSIGGRLVGKRLSVDLGVMAPIEDGEVNFALPWLGITIPVGQ